MSERAAGIFQKKKNATRFQLVRHRNWPRYLNWRSKSTLSIFLNSPLMNSFHWFQLILEYRVCFTFTRIFEILWWALPVVFSSLIISKMEFRKLVVADHQTVIAKVWFKSSSLRLNWIDNKFMRHYYFTPLLSFNSIAKLILSLQHSNTTIFVM